MEGVRGYVEELGCDGGDDVMVVVMVVFMVLT